ncbi:MAG: DUF4922 domain-containing protein [Bacteroidales bacterium]|jgi:hypothetical protein|nr:DUF4922 domain-containing protein [Bacteroidales bacterium]MCI2122023.1 DUF4922 domain-containing protein [Bacteroidales bacterium]MCI2146222.1 DUF4922 domain-containing protein [Bacteroidales bacterium]
MTNFDVDGFFERQLATWPLARKNFDALKYVRVREFMIGGFPFRVQFNPGRMISTGARMDAATIKVRKCFLCRENTPPEQTPLHVKGITGREYRFLVNPYPIFSRHLTIPAMEHTPQRILERFPDMLGFASDLDGYTIFYNGPKCGATAPDHMHFQVGNRGLMPVEDHLDSLHDVIPSAVIIESGTIGAAEEEFRKLYDSLPVKDGEVEPMMNILAWQKSDGVSTRFIIVVYPRREHRPKCYYADGDSQLLISPGSVDLGGLFIVPRERDFDRLTPENIREILNEVML